MSEKAAPRVSTVHSLTRRLFVEVPYDVGKEIERIFDEGGIKVHGSHSTGSVERHTISLPWPKSEEQVNTINDLLRDELKNYAFTTDAQA